MSDRLSQNNIDAFIHWQVLKYEVERMETIIDNNELTPEQMIILASSLGFLDSRLEQIENNL